MPLGKSVFRLAIHATLLALLVVCLSQYQARAQSNIKPGDYEDSLTHGGRTRTYVIHIPPAYDGVKNLPLVILLHGGAGNANIAMRMSNMNAKADKMGFVVVYPNGTGRFEKRLLTWNVGNCCGYALDAKSDDVGFIRELIEKLENELKINSKRVYVTGISNGGMMSYALACELSDKIAAIGVVSGALDYEKCQPKEPVSVLIIHGTDDEHVLYNGGKPKKSADWHPRVDKPVSYAVSFWTKHDGCADKPTREENGGIIKETYSGCKDGTEVILYTIKGGGHTWFGSERKIRFLGEDPTPNGFATDTILDFFKNHTK